MLFIIVIYSGQQQELQGNAQSAITPSFGAIGDCSTNGTCPTGTITPSGPGVTAIPTNTTIQPCTSAQDSSVSALARNRRHRGGGNRNNGGFFQAFLQFFMQLLQFLQQLLGGGTIGNPGNPLPSIALLPSGVQPSTQPNPSVSSTPSQAPCPPSNAPSNAPQPTTTGGNPTPIASKNKHIMIFMMENQSYPNVIGNSSLPYVNSLAKSYELFTNSYGVGHYSLDNYLAIVSGNFYPATVNDCDPGGACSFTDPTLADQMDTAGISWAVYSGGGLDPYPYFPNVKSKDSNKLRSLSNAINDLNGATPPNFVFYIPDNCNQGGSESYCGSSGTPAAGDKYASTALPSLMATNWYKNNGVIIYTYDEGWDDGKGAGEFLHDESNHIVTILISAATAGKPQVTSYVNLFGELSGIEKAYELSCLGQACNSASGVLSLP